MVLIPAGRHAPSAKLDMALCALDMHAPALDELFSGPIRGRAAAIEHDVNGESPYLDPYDCTCSPFIFKRAWRVLQKQVVDGGWSSC